MSSENRYELKTGKFGYYFFDTTIQIDLSLDMVLNKLNNTEKLLIERLQVINYHIKEINILRNKLIILDSIDTFTFKHKKK